VNTTNLTKAERNKIKRLEVLENIAHKYTNTVKIENLFLTKPLASAMNKCRVHSKLMQVFVLDIKNLYANEFNVEWLEPLIQFSNAPPTTMLYSLTKGINEILLFGGMEINTNLCTPSQNNTNSSHNPNDEKPQTKVTKSLYELKASQI
jgi:hypothetical protein